MTKELEALKEIEVQFNELGLHFKESGWHINENCYFIIETALKEKDYLKERVDDLKKDRKELQAHNQMLLKYFTALKIIKRSPVMIICEIYKCAIELKLSYEGYCNYFPDEEDRNIKSKEEYDLLKEVLL